MLTVMQVVADPSCCRCPDCVEAKPVIIAALADREADAPVLWCSVKLAEYKKNPDYAYRVHASIKLTAVPTIVKFLAGAVVASCVDDDCKADAKVRTLFA
jgi:hypothetical protein